MLSALCRASAIVALTPSSFAPSTVASSTPVTSAMPFSSIVTVADVRFESSIVRYPRPLAFTIARLASKSATPPCTSRLHFPVTIAGSCGSPATEPIEPAAEKVSDWNV